MIKRLLFIFCLALVSGGSVLAQSKNITNADLEKFKQKRLQAEKEYRENYEKLGMPSPEELARQDERKRLENAEAAARFRTERLQEEQNQAFREQTEAADNYYRQSADAYQPIYAPNNFGYLPYNYSPYGFYNYSVIRRTPLRPHYNYGGRYNNHPVFPRGFSHPSNSPAFRPNPPRFPRGRH